MEKNEGQISVVIPAYRRHPLTVLHAKYCLESSVLPKEIIIVNDGGDPCLKEMLSDVAKRANELGVKLIYARVEEDILWNYNGACNLGCWLSTGDILAIEDTDHIPDFDTYANGLKSFLEDPSVDRITFGRKVVNMTTCDIYSLPRASWSQVSSWGTNQMVGMLKRDVYLKLKGQDEQMCGNYGWMCYDWAFRRDKVLGVKSKKTNFYWAAIGDEGEPGLKRGMSNENRKVYRDNARAGKLHSKYGILNFHFEYFIL